MQTTAKAIEAPVTSFCQSKFFSRSHSKTRLTQSIKTHIATRCQPYPDNLPETPWKHYIGIVGALVQEIPSFFCYPPATTTTPKITSSRTLPTGYPSKGQDMLGGVTSSLIKYRNDRRICVSPARFIHQVPEGWKDGVSGEYPPFDTDTHTHWA